MRKLLLTICLTFLFYMIHVCIMPHLTVFKVTANALLVCISTVAIAYSMFFAFVSGAIAGIVMETMLAPYNYFYLILYPVLALLGAYLFSDKSESKMEREKVLNEKRRIIRPELRTLMCAGLITLIKETVQRLYVYLGGTAITMDHIVRILLATSYTVLLTLICLLPLRRLLVPGPRLKNKEEETEKRETEEMPEIKQEDAEAEQEEMEGDEIEDD